MNAFRRSPTNEITYTVDQNGFNISGYFSRSRSTSLLYDTYLNCLDLFLGFSLNTILYN